MLHYFLLVVALLSSLVWSSDSESAFTWSGSPNAFHLGNMTYVTPARFHTVAPLTVLYTNESTVTSASIVEVLNHYASFDDVWTWDFIYAPGSSLTIVKIGPESPVLDTSACMWLEAHSVALYQDDSYNATVLAPGPYLVEASGGVSKVYRLYRDTLDAFLFGCIPEADNAFHMLDLYIPGYQNYLIPVPSRLYSLHDARPLAGKRFALKDIYDAKGLQTGAGSRAYQDLYPPASENGPALQKLLDLGAVLVGKTKTSQFAMGADPWEFVDVQYPWNPRGDGYLSAASSSSGSACAIAGYEWIDFALGSDTRGSVRKPAAIVGVYGIRPTWGSMDMRGVMPLASELDTLGFFARDPHLFCEVTNAWYYGDPSNASPSTYARYPNTVLVPTDYFPVENAAAQTLYNEFVDVLNKRFAITPVPVSISDILRTSSLPEIANFTAFQLNSNKLAEYDSWQRVGLPLTERWKEAYGGFPPLDPKPRAAFLRAQAISEDEYQEAIQIKKAFGDFFTANVLTADEESCSNAIMIYDVGTGGLPSYREEALNHLDGATAVSITTPDGGLASNYIASTAGCPDITIPLGQVDYESPISRKTEKLPVSIQMVAYRGCENMLLDMVKDLAEDGFLVESKTGPTAF